jgi:hypothetical protein
MRLCLSGMASTGHLALGSGGPLLHKLLGNLMLFWGASESKIAVVEELKAVVTPKKVGTSQTVDVLKMLCRVAPSPCAFSGQERTLTLDSRTETNFGSRPCTFRPFAYIGGQKYTLHLARRICQPTPSVGLQSQGIVASEDCA